MNETQAYQTLLNQWLEQYQSLFKLLNDEQKALEKRDFAQLEKLVNNKNDLVDLINSQQLPSIINASPANQPKINDLKKFCFKTPELLPIWDNLMVVVEKCQFRNEVNARLIELVTSSTKRTFNLIKGFDPDNNIYDSNGDRKIVKHFSEPLSA